MEEDVIQYAEWLANRVRQAEMSDPKIRPLKNRINELSYAISSAKEKDIPLLLRQQDAAIQELIAYIVNA